MADNPPYMNAHGKIGAVLEKIKTASQPPRFTNDFLYTKLSIKSNSVRPVIPLLKRLGFLGTDGTPTIRYGEFRNSKKSSQAMAQGIKEAYSDLYSRSEYLHDLPQNEFSEVVAEATGLEKGAKILGAIVGTFEALKKFSDFEENNIDDEDIKIENQGYSGGQAVNQAVDIGVGNNLRLGYTINLNLPETTNIAVYDAIFKSLSEHLLKKISS